MNRFKAWWCSIVGHKFVSIPREFMRECSRCRAWDLLCENCLRVMKPHTGKFCARCKPSIPIKMALAKELKLNDDMARRAELSARVKARMRPATDAEKELLRVQGIIPDDNFQLRISHTKGKDLGR